MPASAPPRTRSGGKTSPGAAGSARPSTVAPIRRSGSATRRIGRRVSEASPTSSVSNGRPASRPISSRMVVPELPQSSGPRRRGRPAKPTPRTRASSPAISMSTPSARSAAAVDRLSPPRPSPRASTAPSASAPNSSARCEIDLSPGNPAGPAQRARIAGPVSVDVSARHRCFTTTSSRSRVDFRLFASACSTASSFSASPSRCRRRCAGGRGRAIPRPPAVRPSNTGPSPSSMTIGCRA